MATLRENLTKFEIEHCTAAGIARVQYRLSELKDVVGEAPLSPTHQRYVLDEMQKDRDLWTKSKRSNIEAGYWRHAFKDQVALLHMRRAIILMRETNSWLNP
jgi:hypothetical protein